MSDNTTAEEYRVAAKVLRASGLRDLGRCAALVDQYEREADRLDREAASDTEAEELARVHHRGTLSVRTMSQWDELDPNYQDGVTAGARAVLDHLTPRLLSVEELELLRTACRTHDNIERVNALLQLGCRFGIEKPAKPSHTGPVADGATVCNEPHPMWRLNGCVCARDGHTPCTPHRCTCGTAWRAEPHEDDA